MTDPATTPTQTSGGYFGHWFRRVLHVCMIVIPVIYFFYAKAAASFFYMKPTQLVLVILGFVVLAEIIRIRYRMVLFAQRLHEADHISSFAWGVIAISLVLIFAPEPIYAIPIVAGCAIGDPLMGECRRFKLPTIIIIFYAIAVLILIWFICRLWMPMPWWVPFIMAPITVFAELPNLHWIDDNALMQLAPLVLILIIF